MLDVAVLDFMAQLPRDSKLSDDKMATTSTRYRSAAMPSPLPSWRVPVLHDRARSQRVDDLLYLLRFRVNPLRCRQLLRLTELPTSRQWLDPLAEAVRAPSRTPSIRTHFVVRKALPTQAAIAESPPDTDLNAAFWKRLLMEQLAADGSNAESVLASLTLNHRARRAISRRMDDTNSVKTHEGGDSPIEEDDITLASTTARSPRRQLLVGEVTVNNNAAAAVAPQSPVLMQQPNSLSLLPSSPGSRSPAMKPSARQLTSSGELTPAVRRRSNFESPGWRGSSPSARSLAVPEILSRRVIPRCPADVRSGVEADIQSRHIRAETPVESLRHSFRNDMYSHAAALDHHQSRRSLDSGCALRRTVGSSDYTLRSDTMLRPRTSHFAAQQTTAPATVEEGAQEKLFRHKALRLVARVIIQPNQPADLLCDLPPELRIPLSDIELLGRPISKGTFGTVYKALWRGREVAVKWCHADNPPTVEQLRNFERELNAYWVLEHEHICRFYGACVDSLDTLALVTEFLPRGNAFELFFDNKEVVSAAKRLRMARQLVEVLDHLHSCRPVVIHRDIKTPNLVLDEDLNLKLCDFGKTKFMHRSFLLLDDNGGSPRYMAPECFVPGGVITEKADIWSLACCLIEILGGPIPHEEHYNNAAVIQKILTEQKPPTVPEWFHPDVRQILHHCFSWTAARRPSANQIGKVLACLTPADLETYGMNTRRTQ